MSQHWDRNQDGGMLLTGNYESVSLEITPCPASRKFTGLAVLGSAFIEVGGTWGVPLSEARKLTVSAARKLTLLHNLSP